MKKTVLPAALAAATAVGAEPTWDLDRDPIPAAGTIGVVEVVDGAVTIDGTNSFSLPPSVLGDQQDYTIDFEVTRRVVEQEDTDFISFVSNMDEATGLAFGIVWYPTGWRASALSINGHHTLSTPEFKPGATHRVTLVVENGQLMLFFDGLLRGMTNKVEPSALPLTFGTVGDQPIVPYELRHIRIHDVPVTPASYDPSIEMMRTYSGDRYSMQRADITDPTLPRILVIGDSISQGYRRYIAEHYAGRAYVDYWVSPLMFRLRPEDVAGDDPPILRAWTGVLSNGPYDVISYNHATLHMWDPNRPERCAPDTYPECMGRILDHIRAVAPKTQLLWVRCTPIVKLDGDTASLGSPANARIVQFNELTDPLMSARGIPVVDLYAVAVANLAHIAHDGVHWQAPAYRAMAAAIIANIDRYLPTPPEEP